MLKPSASLEAAKEKSYSMRDIAESTVLLRATVTLPDNLKLATDTFQDGWSFVRSGDVHWLDRKVRKCGWHFIWIGEPSQTGGVERTAQEAIAAALKLALRRLNPDFNAASIDSIALTQYPWFFIAKVRVYPYQIQQDAVLRASQEATSLPMTTPAGPMILPETLAATGV